MKCVITGRLLLIAAACAIAMFGQSVSEPSGLTISVNNSGIFTIQSGNWIYSGNISGDSFKVSGPRVGADDNSVSTNGLFDEFSADYAGENGKSWRMQLRAYRSIPSATISFSPLSTVPNPGAYAVLRKFPITPHHFSNAGWNRAFGLVGWMQHDSPWVFFDDEFRASILSAGSRPISERQVWVNDQSEYGVIALEVDPGNRILNAGDVYSYVITFEQGIGNAFRTWGSTLRNIAGRPATGNQADASLVAPMLSTDAGASYYYKYNSALGYEGTLSAAIESAESVGIPFGLVHFDSWWYLKGGNCSDPGDASFASWRNAQDGVWEFVADPSTFASLNPGDNQDGFIQNLGRGMAHGRWIDPCSPYRSAAPDSTGGADGPPVSGNVIVDPAIWTRIAAALKRSGMVIFEQDFLSTKAKAANTFDDEKFLAAMASAMEQNGIDLQYCMPLARHILQAFQDEHVHTIRVSGDRFNWKHWDQEMYGSIVVNAGGVWPTVDNFRTAETKNLLLAVLSGGPLALSDPIGAFVSIPEAIRKDGVILKPDGSMVPTDPSFVAEAAAVEKFYGVHGTKASNAGNRSTMTLPPLVGHTSSDFGSSKVEYVFAYSRDMNATASVSLSPGDFGFTNDVYIYDYFGKSGWRQPAAQPVVRSVDSQGSYFVIASIGPSGMAFVGDLSRFVPASKQRVPSLRDDGRITATLQFVSGEAVPISIFAPTSPQIAVEGATAGKPVYDATTGLYQVMVSAGASQQATIVISAAQ